MERDDRAAKKRHEFDGSELYLGDELDRETRRAVQAVLPELMSGNLFGLDLKGLASLKSSDRMPEDKAPDAVDYEDISSSELEDDEEERTTAPAQKPEDEGVGADEIARQLRLKMGGNSADDYDEDYDVAEQVSSSSSLPSTTSMQSHANGEIEANPSLGSEDARMGFDAMEKALFGEDEEESERNGKDTLKSGVKQDTEDETDEEDEEDEATVSLPPPAPAYGPSVSSTDTEGPTLPPSVAAVLHGEAQLLTPSVKQICSALYASGGPILKFSEIFGPQRRSKRSRLRQTINLRARAAAAAAAAASGTAEEEDDEEEFFQRLTHTFYLPKKELEADEEDDDAGETGLALREHLPTTTQRSDSEPPEPCELKHKAKQPKDESVFAPLPSPVHESVQTWPWEDEIIWGDEKESKSAVRMTADADTTLSELKTSDALKTSDQVPGPKAVTPLDVSDSRSGRWGALTANSKTTAPAASDDSTVSAVLEQLEEEPVVEPREWSRFPFLNEGLTSGDWLDAVVWDDRHIPPAALNNPLIFDLNDKEMLFEENIKKLEEEEQVTEEAPAEEEVGKIKKRRGRRPKRKIDEIASMAEDDAEEDLDPFNYSLDRIYANASRALAKIRPKNMGKPVVQHSIPALKLSSFKTNFTPEDLRLFHHPRPKLPLSKRIKISPTSADGSRTNPRFKKPSGTIRRKKELSAKDGRIILAEYLEERPPLLNNVGMGTKILNYYRKKDVNDIPADKTREDGDMVLLDQTDECPFLGEVPTGDTVQMMDNNLFRAPIVKHNPPTTDFLLVRSKKNKFYIREMPPVYAVGQEQPVTEVPAPNSRSANNFIKARLQTFIYRLFKKRANQQRVRISDICSAFPSHSETSIRKRLKDCSDFQRGGDDSGWWTLKKDFEMPSEEDLRAMLTPETVCTYESMLAGQQRLLDAGIEHTFNAAGIVQAVAQLEQESGPRLKQAAEFVKEEVCLAPWNTTGNFLSVQHGKGQLQLTGFGDPTGTSVGFSYMRVPQKVQAKQKKAQAPKTSVTGTDADLRKLSLEGARQVLLKFGVSDEVIEKLERWERIDLVREKSSSAGGVDDPNLTKFARGRRHTFQQQQQAYKDECARIFMKQLAFLGLNEPPDDISDDEDVDLGDDTELQDFAGEMERELEALFGEDDSNSEMPEMPPAKPAKPTPRTIGWKKTVKHEADDEEAERRELQKFMEEARETKREEALQASTSSTPNLLRTSPVIKPAPSADLAAAKTPSPTATARAVREPFSPTSGSDVSLDAFPSAGSVPGEAPPVSGEAKKTRKFIKRTVTKKGADGQPVKVVEIISDPKKVEEFLKKSSAAKKNRPKLTAEEEAEKQRVRKEKRRLQEQLRRLKKNREKQRILAERLAEGNRDGTLSNTEGTNNLLVCGACGMVGHMRTNRNCPYYTEDQASIVPKRRSSKKRRIKSEYEEDEDEDEFYFDEDETIEMEPNHYGGTDGGTTARSTTTASSATPTLPEGMVKVEGSKLRFPKAVLSSITPTSTPATSVPSSPLPGASAASRPLKRPKVEPPPAGPTEPPSSEATASISDNTEKKLILRISKKDLPATTLARVKRPAASELSEPTYMLHPPKVPRGRRKSGRGAGVELASFLEKVVLRVKSYEGAYPFLYPVTAKEAPDYHKVIKHPIDLTTIHDKVKAFKYLSQKAFLADIRLMVANCHKYCETRFPALPPIADTLLKIAIDALCENKTEIEELEALINLEAAPTATAARAGTSGAQKAPSDANAAPSTARASPSGDGGRVSRAASKGRTATPTTSVPASPSASFHFSSSPPSPVAPAPCVASTAGSTKVRIKLPVQPPKYS